MHIRQAEDADADTMWDIFKSVIATGDTLPFSDDFDRVTFDSHWFGTKAAYVAVGDSGVLGMYKLGANYPGLGSHVACATYLVSPAPLRRRFGGSIMPAMEWLLYAEDSHF